MIRKALISARADRTQNEVAKNLDIDQRYLSKLELGERNPSANIMARISRFYNEPVEKLFPDIFLLSSTPKKSK